MLAIRRYLTARQSRGDTRGDYDALPLSELGPGSSIPPLPVVQLRSDQPLTPRRVSLTILSTIVAFTGFIFIFSLFGNGVDLNSTSSSVPQHAVQITGNGGFYRDAYPVRSMLKYWELAEREVKERGLDTCSGQLGRELIDAHIRTTVDYCHPPVGPAFGGWNQADRQDGGEDGTSVKCTAPHHDEFSGWWPHPIAPCISTNLRPVPDTYTSYHAQSCGMTFEGEMLKLEMLDGDQKDQKFVGTDIQDGDAGMCEHSANRTILEVPRQDQWNPQVRSFLQRCADETGFMWQRISSPLWSLS